MNLKRTVISLILTGWAIVSPTGCATTNNENSHVDPRSGSLVSSNEPIRNSTFNFSTPQFGDHNQPITEADLNGKFEKEIGLGFFNSVNLGMSGRMGHRAVTEDDFNAIYWGMTSECVDAILGREPDHVVRLGGSLGSRSCMWREENAIICIEFDGSGTLIEKSFTPTQR